MASFASLSFFHSSPFISAIYLFEDPSWPSWVWLPPSHPLFFTFSSLPPSSLSLPLWKTKWKQQRVNSRQERQCFWWSINDAASKCVCFFCDKNETEQGSLQYQRPLPPVRCWAQGEWKSLVLFSYQLSSVSLQMNCWYRLMSYNTSPLILLQVSSCFTDYVSPVCVSLTGSHYITKQPHLPLYLYNRWTISTQARVTLGWWQGNATLSGRRSLLG